jgi:hypothetical protein
MVKVHGSKVTPPLASAAAPNRASMNNVEALSDPGTKVKVTGLSTIPGSTISGWKTVPFRIVNCGGNESSKAVTVVLFRGTVALIFRRSPVPPEQANSTNKLINTSTATT